MIYYFKTKAAYDLLKSFVCKPFSYKYMHQHYVANFFHNRHISGSEKKPGSFAAHKYSNLFKSRTIPAEIVPARDLKPTINRHNH